VSKKKKKKKYNNYNNYNTNTYNYYSNDKVYKGERLDAMPDHLVDEFLKVLYAQSSSTNEKIIAHVILSHADRNGYRWECDEIGNIYVTKGSVGDDEYFPCIASHMDTVHDIEQNFKINSYKDKKDGHTILNARSLKRPTGIGGDDKNGVYSCLYMLERFDKIKAAFFTQEESGCIGSSDAKDAEFFKDVGYIIQLDRWGRSDFINTYVGVKTVSEEYDKIATPIMKKYGYKSTSGLFTDSINLWDNDIGVSCVNVSCGYYEHHTNYEYIDLNQFYHSLLFTEELISQLGTKIYVSFPMGLKSNMSGRDYHSRYYDTDWDYDGYGDYYERNGFKGPYAKGYNDSQQNLLPPAKSDGFDYYDGDPPFDDVKQDDIDNFNLLTLNEILRGRGLGEYYFGLFDEISADEYAEIYSEYSFITGYALPETL